MLADHRWTFEFRLRCFVYPHYWIVKRPSTRLVKVAAPLWGEIAVILAQEASSSTELIAQLHSCTDEIETKKFMQLVLGCVVKMILPQFPQSHILQIHYDLELALNEQRGLCTN